MKFFLYVLILIVLDGCTNRAIYEGIQADKRNECQKLPPSEYDRCIEEAGKPFEQYEREREELLKE